MKKFFSMFLIVSLLASLTGCTQKYKVNCEGRAFAHGLKESYAQGKQVKFSCNADRNSTLRVFLDGEELTPDGLNEKGETGYSFTMPSHDVKLTWEVVSSMMGTKVTDTDELREGTFLFGYYDAITGTEIPRGFYKIIMTYLTDETVKIDVTDTENDPEGAEKTVSYTADFSAYTDVLKIALDAGTDKWDSLKHATCLDGGYYMCRYRTQDGKSVTATSESMPEDGTMTFGEIQLALEHSLATAQQIN